MLACGQGCGCCNPPALARPAQLGGIFSTILDAVGSIAGDPQFGEQVASQARGGYSPITQNMQQIADTVAPDVMSALKAPPDPSKITPQAGQVAQAAAQAIAQKLLAQGYVFPSGTLGAEYQKPSLFDAFGGQNRTVVEIGLGALALFAVVKVLRG